MAARTWGATARCHVDGPMANDWPAFVHAHFLPEVAHRTWSTAWALCDIMTPRQAASCEFYALHLRPDVFPESIPRIFPGTSLFLQQCHKLMLLDTVRVVNPARGERRLDLLHRLGRTLWSHSAVRIRWLVSARPVAIAVGWVLR